MKVYLSVPMIANRSLDRAKLMAAAVVASGHVLTSPWVLGSIEALTANPINVFERDKAGAEGCDILLADVSQPSIGVGMEIMAAHSAGKRIILVSKDGSVTSRMLQHMDRKEFLTFTDDESLRTVLTKALKDK